MPFTCIAKKKKKEQLQGLQRCNNIQKQLQSGSPAGKETVANIFSLLLAQRWRQVKK